ncbi:c-type cytochrome [Planctomicrobium piriforme]|uniref:Cytochrome C oxidase, cbb3-type, subunit III n=1 Tax=Planctomicrobium piriforme TaxID=1576369 RepID=A0A1I3CY57_9PLAN|nr:c-type cytochrome [Planctomicrobium piriforme]SFH79454.1 Cytochrome C oxidase, cbb3-type, subunit III [Planctomicrobium piriforme]
MRTWFSLSAILLLAVGCQKPEFTHRPEFHELESYAQTYASDLMLAYFGTPTEMVVWDRLPLKQNLATGEVEQATTEGGVTKLVFKETEPHQEITPGTELLWMSGELAGKPSAWIAEWDEKTHTATLQGPLATLPAAGTEVVIGPGQVLVRGRHLYAEHCQHCHGVSGDGAGATAQYLNPLPRDYRKGIFKFTLTQASERACRDDLVRVIEDGIPGTYMPSFKLLSPDEMQSIVEYVLWLSMRGETEYQIVRFLSNDYSKKAVAERVNAGLEEKKSGAEDFETAEKIRAEFYELANDPEEFGFEIDSGIQRMVAQWKAAQLPTALVVPKEKWKAADAASIERGRKLYLSSDLSCAACHGDAGFGDGPQTYSITRDLDTGKENAKPGLYDVWGHPIVPRNLHQGIFRGGRRPIDVYARLSAGIKGTPMPAFGNKLKDQDLWDLVNYIYSVPFETEAAGAGTQKAQTAPAQKEVAANE